MSVPFCRSVCLSVCLSFYLYGCVSASVPVCACLSACLSACLPACLLNCIDASWSSSISFYCCLLPVCLYVWRLRLKEIPQAKELYIVLYIPSKYRMSISANRYSKDQMSIIYCGSLWLSVKYQMSISVFRKKKNTNRFRMHAIL